MEEAKLTARVPKGTLTVAKRYAARNNTTLTRLITAYLERIERAETEAGEQLSPVAQRLRGSLSGNVAEDDYLAYLGDKYLS